MTSGGNGVLLVSDTLEGEEAVHLDAGEFWSNTLTRFRLPAKPLRRPNRCSVVWYRSKSFATKAFTTSTRSGWLYPNTSAIASNSKSSIHSFQAPCSNLRADRGRIQSMVTETSHLIANQSESADSPLYRWPTHPASVLFDHSRVRRYAV